MPDFGIKVEKVVVPRGRGGRRIKIHLSKLYSFSGTRHSSSPEHDQSQLGHKGFSRVVYCNDPDNPEAVKLRYRDNYVSTTKYTALNFIPKSLFEQFRRVANIYFLVAALVSFSPLSPFAAPSIIIPLVIVIGATMGKEGVEATSIMFERLSKNGQHFVDETKDHISNYAKAGLRTLVVAYREISEEEYGTWQEEFTQAKASVSADRDELVDAAAGKIERDLILLGATAVEDKLQKGVPDCINKLAQAGIKIWVLTGDKLETAVNIGYACSLLRQGMKQVVITLDTEDINALKKQGDKETIAKASCESITRQIQEGKHQVSSAKQSSVDSALIIDGESLTHALTRNLESSFMDLAVDCASVICCRSSPKQKALVTKLVKTRTGKITLGIGDGANDVSMLQEADIGVGISGVEGMQAVMSSDFAIAQFRFLERLLLVHGHWCYRRISKMICYFFYKNITFGFTLFWFEAYASFSGQPAYNDWYMSFYNVFFTSLPVIALGVFDQDVCAQLCLKKSHLTNFYKDLYHEDRVTRPLPEDITFNQIS